MSILHCYCETTDTNSLSSSLQCRECQKLYHLDCLKNGKPSTLEGDFLFEFVCGKCSVGGTEQVKRLKLHWTHVVQLTLYNLHLQGEGKCGYFRWREHVCSFIDRHWTSFFGFGKKKTTTWHGTVAGTLSAGCPRLFVSGVAELKEPGWWKLTDPVPPSRQDLEVTLAQGCNRSTRKAVSRKSKSAETLAEFIDPAPRAAKQRAKGLRARVNTKCKETAGIQEDFQIKVGTPYTCSEFEGDAVPSLLPDEDLVLSDLEPNDLEIDPGSVSPVSLSSMTMDRIISDACGGSQEAVISEPSDTSLDELETLTDEANPAPDDGGFEPDVTFLENRETLGVQDDDDKNNDFCIIGMGKYEEKQLLHQLENQFASAVANNVKAKRLRRKLILRQLKQERNMPIFDLDKQVYSTSETKKSKLMSSANANSKVRNEYRVLDRYRIGSAHSMGRKLNNVPFITKLIGREENQDLIISPYTARVLKPYIWRDYESKPLKLCLLEDIAKHYTKKNPSWQPPASAPIDYCYVQPHQIPAINALCCDFFWRGIDLSESLQYPDFSCVALYKKVVIGFAFMVPDVKYNEAYISFVFTHPEWRNAGIATFMLYHLIQTCMGKDVTLHVSATNPALLLYQKFGFKVEEFIVDFYEKYFDEDCKDCRHAMFLRLSR